MNESDFRIAHNLYNNIIMIAIAAVKVRMQTIIIIAAMMPPESEF